MKNNYGYDTYRGRSPLRTFLKALVVILVLVLVGCVAVVLWLTERYGVYSIDGMKLVLPWQTQASAAPTLDPDVVPSVVPSQLVVVTPEVTEPEDQGLRAVLLPRTALYDGSAVQTVEEAGGTAALFDMKADDGTLGYVSSLELAEKAKVNAADASINVAIRVLNQDPELYTVARVSCFKDNLLSNADYNLNILTNSGYRWTDPDNLRWASPTSATVQEYITGVCLELAELGFDEILLDNAGYPTEGYLNYIRHGDAYDPEKLDQVITQFYSQLRRDLAKDHPDVKLSVVTTEGVLSGDDVLSGQTAKALAASADRVWCLPPAQDTDYLAALAGAGMTDPEEKLVTIQDAPGGAEENWAVWVQP